jgi:hypothetical protein
MDHKDYDCFLVAILSHGELGYLYSKDAHYKLDAVTSYFSADRCPSLAGKPKVNVTRRSENSFRRYQHMLCSCIPKLVPH